jgi:hypothetical protein
VQQHIQWGLDWLVKAHLTSSAATDNNVLVGQVSGMAAAATR